MDEKSKYYSKLSEEINELGQSDSDAAAKRAKEISLQAKKSGDEGYAIFFEGESLSFEKKYNEAEKLERKAIELIPEVDFIKSNYAVILSVLGRKEEAIKYCDEALKINPKSDHALRNKGVTLSELGRYEEAIKCFDKAIEINPKSEYVLNQKGVSLSKLGRYEEAIRCFDEALKINPKSDQALIRKIVSLSKLGRYKEAIKYCDETLKINPKSDQALGNKGASLFELGHYEEAIKYLDEALKINPKSDQALSIKGASLSKLGHYKEAIKCCDEALKINPKSDQALSIKGASLSERERYEEAIKCLDEALKINPKSDLALSIKGISLSKLRYDEEAIKCFDELLKINPKSDQALRLKGVSLSKLGRYEEAIRCFDEALKINPKSDHALRSKGVVLSNLEYDEEAIKCFDEALKINPKSDHALRSKGVSLINLGYEEEAIKYFDEALKINPKSNLALSNKGASLIGLGRFEEALMYCNEALKINPKSDHALSIKGISLSELGRYEEAIKYYDEALNINPKSDLDLMRKGISLSELGRYEEAIKYYDEALKINPKLFHALRTKGDTLAKQGKFKEAIQCYNKSRKIKEWDEIDLSQIILIYIRLNQLDNAKTIALELKQLLNVKNKSTIGAEYWLKIIEEQKKEKKLEELDDSMLKVLTHFGPEQTQNFLDEIKKQKEKQEQILIADKKSKKLATSAAEGFLSVLRRWNSFTPVMNLQDSKGGGYFLYIARTGIIIDPGFDFIKNYFDEQFGLPDFNYIFLTHSHIDHTADLESLFSLLYESNEKKKKRRSIELYMNIGCMKKISGWLNLKEEYIRQVHILEAGIEVPINDQLTVLPARAKHNEITDDIYSLGYIFKTKDFNIGFTGDTGWELGGSLAEPYKNCRVLVAHLGSIYESEFGRKDRLNKNHLGLLGISGMIGKSKPELCVISEFGEELKDLRREIAEGLTKALNVKCISADVGTEVAFTDPPSIRCSLCGEFSVECNPDEEYQQILFLCEKCKNKTGRGERTEKYVKKGERWELWDVVIRKKK